jgi:chromosome segregation ATPase
MSEDITRRFSNADNDILAQILNELQGLRTRMGSMEGRMSSMEDRMSSIEGRIDSIEKKVDERLHDTRPIWEKAVADIALLFEEQKRANEKLDRVEQRLDTMRDDMRTGFRDLKRQFSILNDTFLEVRADYKDLDTRLYKFEELSS